jgi:hypothetical protein
MVALFLHMASARGSSQAVRKGVQAMAHLIVNAVGTETTDGTILVVAVSGSEDGLARTGLLAEHFSVYHIPIVQQEAPAMRSIGRVVEGPEGCYSLLLAPAPMVGDGRTGRSILSVAVHAPTQSGWADEHGLCIAASA